MVRIIWILCFWVGLMQCTDPSQTAGGASDTEVGIISGIARGLNGYPLPNAQVELFESTETGAVNKGPLRKTTSNSEGYFTFNHLPLGSYNLSGVSMDSSQVYVEPGLTIDSQTKVKTVSVDMQKAGSVFGKIGFKSPFFVHILRHQSPFLEQIRQDSSFYFPVLPPGESVLLTILSHQLSGAGAIFGIDTVFNTSGTTDTLSNFLKPDPVFTGDSLLVSGFESSANTIFETQWKTLPHQSHSQIIPPETGQSSGALNISCEGSDCKTTTGFLVGDSLSGLPFVTDLAQLHGISFLAKGREASLKVYFQSPFSDDIGILTIDEIPEQWTRFTVFANDFTQPQWKNSNGAVAGMWFEIKGNNSPGTHDTTIDELYFIRQ